MADSNCHPWVILTQARPLAPNPLATSMRRSIRLRAMSAPPLTTSPETCPPFSDRLPEHFELDVFGDFVQVTKLQPEATIGFFGPIPRRGFLIGQARKRRRQRNAGGFLAHESQQFFRQVHDVLTFHKRHLKIDLRKLGLPVEPEIFVAEASGV